MSQKKQILFLPSFFPSINDNTKGIFVKEQVELIQSKYDVYVVYFIHHRLSAMKYILNSFFKTKKNEFECIKDQEGYKIWNLRLIRLKKPNSPALYGYSYIIDTINLILIKNMVHRVYNHLNKKRISVDLIHAHTIIYGGIISYYFSKCYKTKYIVTEHQAIDYNQSYRINKMIKKVMSDCNLLALVSSFQNKLLKMRGIMRKVYITGNLVDDSVFKPSLSTNEEFKIVFITYPDPIKDNETFFKAISILDSLTNLPLKVDFIASFDKKKILEQKIRNLGNADHYNLHYNLTREQTVNLIKRGNVLVSTSQAETFGLSVCESLMCGNPVVVTASGGIDEMVTPENGIKVPVGDSTAVAEGIMKIMNGDFKYDPVKIRNSVLHKFGREAFLKKTESIYNRVLLSKNQDGNS